MTTDPPIMIEATNLICYQNLRFCLLFELVALFDICHVFHYHTLLCLICMYLCLFKFFYFYIISTDSLYS